MLGELKVVGLLLFEPPVQVDTVPAGRGPVPVAASHRDGHVASVTLTLPVAIAQELPAPASALADCGRRSARSRSAAGTASVDQQVPTTAPGGPGGRLRSHSRSTQPK